jgi:hypothetical protein
MSDKLQGMAIGGLQGALKSAMMGTEFSPMSMISPQGVVSDLAGLYGKEAYQPGYQSKIGELLGSLTNSLGLGKTAGGILQGLPSMALGMVPGVGPFAGVATGFLDSLLGTATGKPGTNWGNFLGNAAIPAALGMFAGPVGGMFGAAVGPMASYGINQALHAMGLIDDPGLWGVNPETGLMNKTTADYYTDAVAGLKSGYFKDTMYGTGLKSMVDAYYDSNALGKSLDSWSKQTPEAKGWGSWGEIGAKTGDRGLVGGGTIGGEAPSYGGEFGGGIGGIGDPGGSMGESFGTESYGGELGKEARGEGDL